MLIASFPSSSSPSNQKVAPDGQGTLEEMWLVCHKRKIAKNAASLHKCQTVIHLPVCPPIRFRTDRQARGGRAGLWLCFPSPPHPGHRQWSGAQGKYRGRQRQAASPIGLAQPPAHSNSQQLIHACRCHGWTDRVESLYGPVAWEMSNALCLAKHL